MHIRRYIILGALTPGLAVIARTISRAATLLVVVCASGVLGGLIRDHLERYDPRLVRAACASRVASDAARRVYGVLDLGAPGAREVRDGMIGAQERERDAWDGVPLECR